MKAIQKIAYLSDYITLVKYSMKYPTMFEIDCYSYLNVDYVENLRNVHIIFTN